MSHASHVLLSHFVVAVSPKSVSLHAETRVLLELQKRTKKPKTNWTFRFRFQISKLLPFNKLQQNCVILKTKQNPTTKQQEPQKKKKTLELNLYQLISEISVCYFGDQSTFDLIENSQLISLIHALFARVLIF